ncbi:MAG: thioesterase II family protein [Vicinamibacterales bacterium]
MISPRPNRAPAVRLVCIPHAGGGVGTFAGWPDRLPASELNIVQLPGRGTRLREAPLASVAQAADGLALAIGRLPAYPTVLFGHGLGALIAFETARRLHSRAWPLVALFPSGCRAPQLPGRGALLADLSEPDFVEEVRRRSGELPEAIFADGELRQVTVAALRSEFAMAASYGYEEGEPLECPIVACGGRGDDGATREELEAWKAQTRGRAGVRLFEGGPLYLLQERSALTGLIANQLTVLLGAMSRWTAVP